MSIDPLGKPVKTAESHDHSEDEPRSGGMFIEPKVETQTPLFRSQLPNEKSRAINLERLSALRFHFRLTPPPSSAV